jgi:hypothetical protein
VSGQISTVRTCSILYYCTAPYKSVARMSTLDRPDDIQIPSSPSSSSLTSEADSFDHEADPSSPSKPPTLGLRELAAKAASKRRAKRRTCSEQVKEIKLLRAMPDLQTIGDNQVTGKGAPTAALGSGINDLPFARDVEIRGWKIVGGKSWTGGGKLGAYVGGL